VKLKEAIKTSTTCGGWMILTKKIDDCEDLTKALTLVMSRCAPGTVDHAAAKDKIAALEAEITQIRKDRRSHERVRSNDYRTILYSIRAHHRGRVHRTKERKPTGQVVTLGLEDQAKLIAPHEDTFTRDVTDRIAS
jgi:protein involved in sex pheromone biosynthesis